jgi:hypothetical protein
MLTLTSPTLSPAPTLPALTLLLTPTSFSALIQYHEPPDEFVQDRIAYVKRAIMANKGCRVGLSHIWRYGL